MRIVISGIPIDVQKKNIKNMHLQVKPPDGHVVISAPLSVDDKAIEAYARTQLALSRGLLRSFRNSQGHRGVSMFPVRRCISGESSTSLSLSRTIRRTASRFRTRILPFP